MRKQSAKAYIFHSPRKGGVGHAEVFLDKATQSGPTRGVIQRIGKPSFCASVPGTQMEICGRMVRSNYDVPEGEVLKVFITARTGYGDRPRTGCVFVRVRAKAAHRVLRFKMLDHADVAYTHAEMEGTFDVITAAEAKALGCPILKQFAACATPSAAAAVLTENVVVQEEVEQAVVVQEREVTTADGTTTTVRSVKRKRRGIAI